MPFARLAVDIGGTFTDLALEHDGRRFTSKVLTTPTAPEEGVMAGISSGAALAATLQVARRLDKGLIVTVFPDGAEKYLTEKFWTADA